MTNELEAYTKDLEFMGLRALKDELNDWMPEDDHPLARRARWIERRLTAAWDWVDDAVTQETFDKRWSSDRVKNVEKAAVEILIKLREDFLEKVE